MLPLLLLVWLTAGVHLHICHIHVPMHHTQVQSYLEHAFGPLKLQQMSAALCRPALDTCLRVNTLKTTPQVNTHTNMCVCVCCVRGKMFTRRIYLQQHVQNPCRQQQQQSHKLIGGLLAARCLCATAAAAAAQGLLIVAALFVYVWLYSALPGCCASAAAAVPRQQSLHSPCHQHSSHPAGSWPTAPGHVGHSW